MARTTTSRHTCNRNYRHHKGTRIPSQQASYDRNHHSTRRQRRDNNRVTRHTTSTHSSRMLTLQPGFLRRTHGGTEHKCYLHIQFYQVKRPGTHFHALYIHFYEVKRSEHDFNALHSQFKEVKRLDNIFDRLIIHFYEVKRLRARFHALHS